MNCLKCPRENAKHPARCFFCSSFPVWQECSKTQTKQPNGLEKHFTNEQIWLCTCTWNTNMYICYISLFPVQRSRIYTSVGKNDMHDRDKKMTNKQIYMFRIYTNTLFKNAFFVQKKMWNHPGSQLWQVIDLCHAIKVDNGKHTYCFKKIIWMNIFASYTCIYLDMI